MNTIGDYDGTRMMQVYEGEEVSGFEITAGGNWTYVIAPLAGVEVYDCPIEGTGDDVIGVRQFDSSGGPADLTFDTSTNFAIWAYGLDGRDLIVNDIGPYEGTVRVASGLWLWDITCDGGNWTIDCG